MSEEVKKILEHLRYMYDSVIDDKIGALMLIDETDDDPEYYKHRFLVEKEKADIIDDIIKYILETFK